jgi:hypothetical protein
MSEGLQVFLVSLDGLGQCIVYSDPLNQQAEGNCIYNAGSLALIPDPYILAFTGISGSVTPTFGVRPLILGYANGIFEVLYAPSNSPYLFRSDGSLARHNRSEVKVKSVIRVPDLQQSSLSQDCPQQLVEIPLAEPNEQSIQRYIQMSHQGVEYSTNRTYQELTARAPPPSQPVPPVVPPIPTPVSRPAASESPGERARSPSPRQSRPLSPEKEPTDEQEERLRFLQQRVDDLEKIVEAMNRRSYKIYPVDMPTQLRVGKRLTPVIEVDEAQKKVANGEIERVEFIPSFQPYAGSNRSNNRLITFYAKNGDIYHVRADYDPKENKINPPK